MRIYRGFEFKILLMIVIFVYAFFKFTWAMRQFNFLSLMIGTAPAKSDEPAAIESFINRAATLASLAGENSNRGLRAFYFAMAAMSWFMHAVLFMAVSALVVGILYHREFRSRTLLALMEGADGGRTTSRGRSPGPPSGSFCDHAIYKL